MPAFALAFGSFGDFVTAIQLAIKLSDLLIRRRGARSSIWIETQSELNTLNKELELLKSCPIPDPLVSVGIQQELTRCDSDVQALVKFLKDALDQGLWQKVLWTVSEERTLAALKAKIAGRRQSLTFLVGLMNSGALQAARARLDEVHRAVGDANTGIVAVAHGVDEIGSQVRRGNATIDTIAHGVDGIVHSVDGIAHSVDGMEAHVNHANAQIQAQFATYQAQIVEVVTHLPRGVANDIFFVLSPTGVPIPISIVYCSTYEKLDGILKATLRDQKAAGARYVEQGSYAIVSSSGDIVSPAEFNATIRGSVCLEMSIAQSLRQLFSSWRGPRSPRESVAAADSADEREKFRRVHYPLNRPIRLPYHSNPAPHTTPAPRITPGPFPPPMRLKREGFYHRMMKLKGSARSNNFSLRIFWHPEQLCIYATFSENLFQLDLLSALHWVDPIFTLPL
ncbi:hypothetical protein C8R46DRAFT_1363251 [Mycena filopes]|nr:hypothetical protein C8R46DRAFT_1363251 [Mycena filopes]